MRKSTAVMSLLQFSKGLISLVLNFMYICRCCVGGFLDSLALGYCSKSLSYINTFENSPLFRRCLHIALVNTTAYGLIEILEGILSLAWAIYVYLPLLCGGFLDSLARLPLKTSLSVMYTFENSS